MNRRKMLALAAIVAIGFVGVRAEGTVGTIKPTSSCACCGDSCGCSTCACESTTRAKSCCEKKTKLADPACESCGCGDCC